MTTPEGFAATPVAHPGASAPAAAGGARPLALVTGAARGIGAAIAVALAQGGFDVAVLDRAGADTAEVTAAVQSHGARSASFAFDLADAAGHEALVQRVSAWGGPVACLVNNAGIGAPSRGDLLDVSAGAFDLVMDINLRGTFFLTQAVARHMLAAAAPAAAARAAAAPPVAPASAQRCIVTVSSVSAEQASIERGEYCLSKAGLGMLTKLFALRLAPHGIPVFEVRPGVIRTPMTEKVADSYDQRIAGGLVPMARWGLPEDVARAVAGLASGAFAFATGSVLNLDGALSIPRL